MGLWVKCFRVEGRSSEFFGELKGVRVQGVWGLGLGLWHLRRWRLSVSDFLVLAAIGWGYSNFGGSGIRCPAYSNPLQLQPKQKA